MIMNFGTGKRWWYGLQLYRGLYKKEYLLITEG